MPDTDAENITPTATERHYGAHRRIAEAQSQLVQAASFYEDWPSEDDDGSNFADNARMVLDGINQALDGMAEIVWARYGRKPRAGFGNVKGER